MEKETKRRERERGEGKSKREERKVISRVVNEGRRGPQDTKEIQRE